MYTNTSIRQNTDIATEYNPFISPQLDNPYPVYARARKEAPIFYHEMLGLWIVTRYDDISRILKDPIRFSSAHKFDPAFPLPPIVLEILKQGYPKMFMLPTSDPPNHKRLRGLFNKGFSIQKVAAMELPIKEIANSLVDSFIHKSCVDLIAQYSRPLAMRVISDMIGLPLAEKDIIKQWCDAIPRLLWEQNSLEQQLVYAHNVVALQHYLSAHIEARRAVPQHDMLTDLINACLQGEVPLVTSEIVDLVITLLFATNVNMLKGVNNAVMVFLNHPTQLQDIRENLGLVDNALEEGMRLESAIQGLIRTARETVEIGGVTIPAGAKLQIMLASANHDETYFPNPELFDIHRQHLGNKHFAFGVGMHSCIGIPLTRLLGRIMIQVLLQRLPNLRLKSNQTLEFKPNLIYREVKHLFVEWDTPVTVGS